MGEPFNDDVMEFLTIDELARVLKCSKSTIYQRTCRNEIPHYKNGRLLLFRLRDVLDSLERKGPGNKKSGR